MEAVATAGRLPHYGGLAVREGDLIQPLVEIAQRLRQVVLVVLPSCIIQSELRAAGAEFSCVQQDYNVRESCCAGTACAP